MQDFEKFDELLNGQAAKGETEDMQEMVDLVDQLKRNFSHATPAAENSSRQRLLEEVEAIRAESETKRLRRLGAVFAWAVPVILILALAGVLFGNRPSSDPESDIDTLSQPEEINVLAPVAPTKVEEETDEEPLSVDEQREMEEEINVLEEPAVEEGASIDEGGVDELLENITPTRPLFETEPLGTEISTEVDHGREMTKTREAETVIVTRIPTDSGGEIPIPQPQIPEPIDDPSPPPIDKATEGVDEHRTLPGESPSE